MIPNYPFTIRRLRNILPAYSCLTEYDRALIEWAANLLDKLPLTTDGVPVIPGETYWCSWYDDDEKAWPVRSCYYVGYCRPHREWAWVIPDCPWDGDCAPPEFDVYSTKEAAEAGGE